MDFAAVSEMIGVAMQPDVPAPIRIGLLLWVAAVLSMGMAVVALCVSLVSGAWLVYTSWRQNSTN